jgi:hypothetical protein
MAAFLAISLRCSVAAAPGRSLSQIAVATESELEAETFFALCDDGSIWAITRPLSGERDWH